MAMGSPMSAVVANLVMDELESNLFKQDKDWLPRFWFRYVDDTFAMTLLDKVFDHLLEKLVQVYIPIKFTKEMEMRVS